MVRAGLVVSLSALVLCSALRGGEVIALGPKDWEKSFDIKSEDPKFKIELDGKVFLMPAKKFDVKLEPGHRYRFTLDTDDPKLDPFLAISNSKGDVLLFDDDGGGKLNSKLTFSAFDDKGHYQLVAASLHGNPGPAVLKATSVARFSADKKTYEPSKDPVKIKGELNAEYQERHYQVRLKGGKTYKIELSSTKFDSYLELRDSDGRLVAEDDDSGGKFNARITKNISKDGMYRIIAASTNLAQNGPFVLEVREE